MTGPAEERGEGSGSVGRVRTITSLEAAGEKAVRVVVEGSPWRTLPVEAVARLRLAVGQELTPALQQRIRRESKRSSALRTGVRLVSQRERSRAELDAHLRGRGFSEVERRWVTARLARAGALDDERFASAEAARLVERGFGNAVILKRLEAAGISEELCARVVSELPGELERARAVIARLGQSRRAIARLARRGFEPEVIIGLGYFPGALGQVELPFETWSEDH